MRVSDDLYYHGKYAVLPSNSAQARLACFLDPAGREASKYWKYPLQLLSPAFILTTRGASLTRRRGTLLCRAVIDVRRSAMFVSGGVDSTTVGNSQQRGLEEELS